MKRVLLVEDDEGQRITMSIALSGKGYEVDAVENWREAMKRVESTSYEGIVLDIKMPVVDGIELAKRIRRVKPNSKIILISGFRTDEEMKDIDVDIEAFFEKPLNIDELADCLKKFSREAKDCC